MAIHQLQIAYESVADRLLLRVSTTAGEEFLAHLTRRFVRELWPMLARTLAEVPGPAAAGTTPGAPSGRFDRPYQPPADVAHPLGLAPLLVAEARIDRDKASAVVLVLREHRQRSLSLTLNAPLLQVFCAMLRAGVRGADWDLALADAPGEGTPAAPPPTLH